MKEQEYIKNVCNKCKYKDNNSDICEIRHMINGEIKCVNYVKCGLIKRIIRYIRGLFKSENGTSILR